MSGTSTFNDQYTTALVSPATPIANPDGTPTNEMFRMIQHIWTRTGGATGVGTPDVQQQAAAAQNTANSATTAAGVAQSSATAANTAVAAETAARIAADATLQTQITGIAGQVGTVTLNGTSATATAGGGAAPPGTVSAFLNVVIGATAYRIPLYLP